MQTIVFWNMFLLCLANMNWIIPRFTMATNLFAICFSYTGSQIFLLWLRPYEGFPGRTIWGGDGLKPTGCGNGCGLHTRICWLGGRDHFTEDVSAIIDGIRHVVSDGKYRRNIIRGGRQLACQNTLEVQSKQMVKHISNFLNENLTERELNSASMKLALFTSQFPGRVSTFIALDIFTFIQSGFEVIFSRFIQFEINIGKMFLNSTGKPSKDR